MVSFLIGFSMFMALVVAGMIFFVLGLVVVDHLERALHALLVHGRSYAISHHLLADDH